VTKNALKKLTITHLRGAVGSFELPFEPGKKLTVIYGENGTGKSTICDSLELLGVGKVGSLENRGLGRTSAYWNTISKTAADVAVSLEAADATCHAKVVRGNVVVSPPETRPRVEVLRRSQILNLLEAQPSARYTAISRFIDVSGVEAAENALRGLIRDLQGRLDTAAARIEENRDALQQFAAVAGQPASGAVAWAEAETVRDAHAAAPALAALRLLQTAYDRIAGHPAHLLDADTAVQAADEAVALADQKAEATLQAIGSGATEMVAVLTSAQNYLHKHPGLAVCPLCESADAAEGLSERLAARLGAFAAFQQAQTAQRAATDALSRATHERERVYGQAKQDAAAFARACADAAALDTDTAPDAIALPPLPVPEEHAALVEWLGETAALPTQWQGAEAKLQDRHDFVTTLRGALHTYTENLQTYEGLFTLLPALQYALDIVEEERKKFTDTILQSISHEVGRLYEAVHPGEGLDTIHLTLDATHRASLEIGSSFGGFSGLPPQAYFSQAHLDTLGLCVFLALAQRDDPAGTILVLDDVLASVDAPHVDRLILMLYAEIAAFRHCIVTTHYGPWRHKIRWGWLKHDRCQFVELSRWTNAGGMTLVRSVPEVERLRALLADPAPDPQLVCAKAGVILEAALDFLTYQYACDVPRKHEPRYTLGELLPAVSKKKLRPALRVEVREGTDAAGAPCYRSVSLEPMLNELEQIAQARNVFGCHFNEIAFDILDADALHFGELVLELIEALADPDAGWPGKEKAGSYWANSGETRRLYPLKQPS